MSSNNDMNAFEWLAGGLFFGGGGNNNNSSGNLNKRELQSIENCKDVKQLWTGVQENFEQIFLEYQQNQQQQQQQQEMQLETNPSESQAALEAAAAAAQVGTGQSTAAVASSSSPECLTVLDFLSARLARLRFLLFEERRTTSSSSSLNSTSNFPLFQNMNSSIPSVAVATVQFFCQPPPPPPPESDMEASSSQAAENASNTADASGPIVLWPKWIRPEHFQLVPFESRKVLTHLFCYLLVSGLDGPDAALYRDSVMAVFVQSVVAPQFFALMTQLVAGYQETLPSNMTNANNTNTGGGGGGVVGGSGSGVEKTTILDIALHCGSMYRSLLRHGPLYQLLVGTTASVTQFVFPFLDSLVHSPNFDVASDAMECLRLVLAPSSSKATTAATQASAPNQPSTGALMVVPVEQMNEWAAEFMTRDYEALFDDRFVPHLLYANEYPNNYMTKRGALQILSTVLLTRANYNVMVRFVASSRNLKVILLLLRHTSPHITLDAFHVFKVFVANPHKPPEVIRILKDNQVKLCAYLATLHAEKAQSDAQFRDEKALIIATIEAL